MNYYNEIDPFAATWLENLINAGHIPGGVVDRRDIRDVSPRDLAGYVQCHFFAGIGGWSRALQIAGWPVHRPAWTGSCPCQPFSQAGRGAGFADERHLWPAFFHLIGECRPPIVFGEQVASKDGLAWFDLVSADLEGANYAVGAADLCAAGVGAPHIRQRLWWVADADGRHASTERQQRGWQQRQQPQDGGAGRVADANQQRYDRTRARSAGRPELADNCGAIGLADHSSAELEVGSLEPARAECEAVERGGETDGMGVAHGDGRSEGQPPATLAGHGGSAVATSSGAWSDIEWLPCRDGKSRPTQLGLFPLAHGIPNRVGKLRAYGNAIVPQVAATFIEAVMENGTGTSP